MAPDLQVRQATSSNCLVDPARPDAEKVRCRGRVQQRLGQEREVGALRRFARGSGARSLSGSSGGSEAGGGSSPGGLGGPRRGPGIGATWTFCALPEPS